MSTDTIPTSARHATLQDLAQILTVQHDLKDDHVVSAGRLRSAGGMIFADPLDPDAAPMGPWRPTEGFDGDVASKLGIPLPYVRRLRAERPDLYDANFNGWTRGSDLSVIQLGEGLDGPTTYGPDGRNFLVRTFRNPDPMGEGIGRALLSDSFGRFDNLDVLTAALTAIRDSGIEAEVYDCDLTDSRMRVRIAAPAISMLAPELLDGYRTPWNGKPPAWQDLRREHGAHHIFPKGEEPIVFSGLVLGNSETGDGRFTIAPQILIARCTNGLVYKKDMVGKTHLGSKMSEGVVRWSDETQRRNVELVQSQTRDAVQTFLDVEYMRTVVEEISAKATTPVTKAADVIETLGKELHFSAEVTASILDHFIRGGQTTCGGIMQAVTSVAQEVTSADVAYDLEMAALDALDVAARLVKA